MIKLRMLFLLSRRKLGNHSVSSPTFFSLQSPY